MTLRNSSGRIHLPGLKTYSNEQFTTQLREACKWLNINRGRAIQYIQLHEEFSQACTPSEKQILAYYESYDLVELYTLFESREGDFPGLTDKLRDVYQKGPLLTEDENPSTSSNKQRNDAFVFLLAGRFLAVGIHVVKVNGVGLHGSPCKSRSDFEFKYDEHYFSVECKRLQSESQLEYRAKQARKQIKKSGQFGIIAMDCSVIFRPKGTVFENFTQRGGETISSAWLEAEVASRLHRLQSPESLGFILFCRFPMMTPIRIVNKNNNSNFRRDCATSWLGVTNPNNPHRRVLEKLIMLLEQKWTSLA